MTGLWPVFFLLLGFRVYERHFFSGLKQNLSQTLFPSCPSFLLFETLSPADTLRERERGSFFRDLCVSPIFVSRRGAKAQRRARSRNFSSQNITILVKRLTEMVHKFYIYTSVLKKSTHLARTLKTL
jgi:hypothetical protein